MASPFELKIITPEKTFFSGETTQITVRTSGGDIGILAHHTSLVAALPAGPLKVRQEDGTFRAAYHSTIVRRRLAAPYRGKTVRTPHVSPRLYVYDIKIVGLGKKKLATFPAVYDKIYYKRIPNIIWKGSISWIKISKK